MSRILLAGVGPMPGPQETKVFAPGLRLASFLEQLRGAGHEVEVREMAFGSAGPELGIRHAPFDAVVALTDVAALAAVNSGWPGPLYVDYNGHPMAERQQQAAAHGSNASLAEQWLAVLPVLLRADRFSVCSRAQRIALAGELGAAGRLNAETCGTDFIDVIRPDLPFKEPFNESHPGYLASKGVPAGARVIFSSGGFNTWFDEETLFEALERVFDGDPAAVFVCCGGRIAGHVEVVWDRFAARVAASPHRARYHLLGWVPQSELADAMLGAHVAANCDRWSWEGELGYRNRIMGWLWAGIRAVTTVTGPEIADLAARGFARAVPEGDPEALAGALREELARGRHGDLAALHRRLLAEWSSAAQFGPLLRWAAEPKPAPDRAGGRVANPLADLQRRFLSDADFRGRAESAARRLLGSRMMQLYGKMNPENLAALEELLGGDSDSGAKRQ